MAMPTQSAPGAECRPFDPSYTACFSVQAAADPGVMSRVLELFAKRGLVPTSWHSRVGGMREDELIIDIQMMGMVRTEADYVAACMRQIPDVDAVLTSERFCAAAE
jgi:acetolactate synthase small subunit